MAFWVPWERRLFCEGSVNSVRMGKILKGLWGEGREWMRICYERKRDLPHCGSPRRRMIVVVGLSIEKHSTNLPQTRAAICD